MSALLLVLGSLWHQAQGQITVQRTGIHHKLHLDEGIPITNAETGKLITLKQYHELVNADRYGYHLLPDYNEYGEPQAYTMRKATAEERDLRGFRDRDPEKQPKVGQPIAPFSMTGEDKKVYRSADLLGKVVVLSFLVNLQKPFWSDRHTAEFADALKPYRSDTSPVVLGVIDDEIESPDASTLPFVPVLNGHGFHGKYHIISIPTLVVIDKKGNVAATLEGGGVFDQLKQVLATVAR